MGVPGSPNCSLPSSPLATTVYLGSPRTTHTTLFIPDCVCGPRSQAPGWPHVSNFPLPRRPCTSPILVPSSNPGPSSGPSDSIVLLSQNRFPMFLHLGLLRAPLPHSALMQQSCLPLRLPSPAPGGGMGVLPSPPNTAFIPLPSPSLKLPSVLSPAITF